MGKSRTEATRAERKAKKRAAEDAIPDVPETWAADVEGEGKGEAVKAEKKEGKKRKRSGGDDEEVEAVSGSAEGEKESKKDRKKRRKEAEEEGGVSVAVQAETKSAVKKEKKVKKDKVQEEPAPAVESIKDTEMPDAPKKSKKERKAERKAKDAIEAAKNGTPSTPKKSSETTPATNGDAKPKSAESAETAEEKKSKKNNRNREKKRKGKTETAATNGEAGKEEAGSGKDARFIVFVGNLPFTANSASITSHFASVKPKSIRAPTEKGSGTKSKGFAFVEFEGYDHMKTALKLFHHSTFDDGKSAPRKINVDLTVGGGGNTTARKTKIADKNVRLNEQRVRRMQEEEKAKLTKKAEGGAARTAKVEVGDGGIHPSRRARVPGA